VQTDSGVFVVHGAGVRRTTYLCLDCTKNVDTNWNINFSYIIIANFDHAWAEHYPVTLNCAHSTSRCIWRECTTTTAACQLNIAVPPVVAANGGALNNTGRTSLAVEVTRLKVDVFISGGGSTDAGVHSWCGLPSATQVCHGGEDPTISTEDRRPPSAMSEAGRQSIRKHLIVWRNPWAQMLP
jgi:hypothetical protein